MGYNIAVRARSSMDRASDFESAGWGFESLRARQRKRLQGYPKPLGSFVFARWVSESRGSIIETQDALGHRHAATTGVYVQRVTVKKDKHSTTILDRLDVQVRSRLF